MTDSRFFDVGEIDRYVRCAMFLYGVEDEEAFDLRVEAVYGMAAECRDGMTPGCYDPAANLIRLPLHPYYADGGVQYDYHDILWHELTHWGLHYGIAHSPDGNHVRPEWWQQPSCVPEVDLWR